MNILRVVAIIMMLMQGNMFYPSYLKVTKIEKGIVTLERLWDL